MRVTVEEQDPCKVRLNIEVDAETVGKTIDQVYRDYGKQAAVPGFRKGKAPRHLVERFVSAESVKKAAIQDMVGPAYLEAIKQESIVPYADPDVEVVQYEPGQPFVFNADVPLPPKVELGDFKGIEVERRKVEITDEDVDSQLKSLQESHTTAEKVEGRGVQAGDIILAEMASWAVGEEMPEPRRTAIRLGQNVPGFDEQVIGLNPGERKQFEIAYPEDWADKEMAGKSYMFDVSIESIREVKAPELTDDFIKTVSDFQTLDELKEDLKKHLIESANNAADREVEHKVIDEIVNRSTIHIPEVMVEHEVEHDVHELQERLIQQRIPIEAYLKRVGKTEEEIISHLRDEAAARLRIGLVLGEVGSAENIQVTDEDIEAEIDRVAEESKAERADVEEHVESHGGKDSLRNSIMTRKIMELLKSVSVIK
jgi:trigger factor